MAQQSAWLAPIIVPRVAAGRFVTRHATQRIRHPDGSRFRIDQEIVPLIRGLWRRGIETRLSCQDIDGRVWIAFAHTIDLEQLIDRLDWTGATPSAYELTKSWEIAWGMCWGEAFAFEPRIWFPHADLSTIQERLLATPEERPEESQ
jgi:hypothetical protein